MKHKFWKLYGPGSQRKIAEWIDEEMDLDTVKCHVSDGHQHAGKRLTDLSIWLRGSAAEDFVWTWYSDCLIQDHVLNFLREQEFTGFDVKPVRARFKSDSKKPAPKLWELVVMGWAGMAAPESGITMDDHCPACGHTHYSGFSRPENLIDEAKWDGSDFFMVWPLPRYVFVTERVAEAIRERGFSGVTFTAIEDLEPTDGHSPGRLSYVMPEARARALGEPLGIY
jgi:Protein of unknown function (Gmx_para_CXXCG)